jgi:hypothetical protein
MTDIELSIEQALARQPAEAGRREARYQQDLAEREQAARAAEAERLAHPSRLEDAIAARVERDRVREAEQARQQAERDAAVGAMLANVDRQIAELEATRTAVLKED